MNAAKGLIALLSPDGEATPSWWTIAEGRILSRSGQIGPEAARDRGPVMLVLPPSVATLRRVELDAEMPPAQARVVAVRKALEASLSDAAAMHAVALDRDEDTPPGVWHVAMIARADLGHCIGWAQLQGVEPDIILPLGAILPPPEQGYIRAGAGGIDVLRGPDVAVPADEPWVQAAIDQSPDDSDIEAWPPGRTEGALIAALERPPVNLRSGAFAIRRRSGADAGWLKRISLLAGAIVLISLGIGIALIARYAWSASSLDARTVELAKPFAPSAADAPSALAQVDRRIAEQGGAYAFTGPLAGLMNAMRPVPGVSLSALSLNEDGLLHATLASARAEDINTVLLAVQGAGYRITATSSTDPGGRVLAEITVKP
ncbi:MAG: type II secretion system protein GspL [Sphingobium sp.]